MAPFSVTWRSSQFRVTLVCRFFVSSLEGLHSKRGLQEFKMLWDHWSRQVSYAMVPSQPRKLRYINIILESSTGDELAWIGAAIPKPFRIAGRFCISLWWKCAQSMFHWGCKWQEKIEKERNLLLWQLLCLDVCPPYAAVGWLLAWLLGWLAGWLVEIYRCTYMCVCVCMYVGR